jgi:hypothetical protein
MLMRCPECDHEISDRAQSCPNCGHPQHLAGPRVTAIATKRRSPLFVSIAAVAFVLCFATPRLLLFFPMMMTFACAIVSLARRERGRIGAIAVLFLTFGLFIVSETSSGRSDSDSTRNVVEVVDWNWQADAKFGTRGTIKWNVQVRNKSSQNIGSVKVEFATYDKEGKLISTTFTYVSAIPPGESRSSSSYADLYRTEKKATVKISNVYFAK